MSSLLPAIDFTSMFFLIQWGVKLVMYKNKTYQMMNDQTQMQFDNRVVSTIHSLISPINAIRSIYYQGIKPFSNISELIPSTLFSIQFSTGYFLWDVFASLDEKDLSFLLHAIACLGIFGMGCVDPSITLFVLSFLIYELSTPFINARWFLLKFNPTRFRILIKILEKGVFLLFFIMRICIGIPMQYNVFTLYHSYFKEFPTIKGAGIMAANMGLGGLNLFWFGKMVRNFLKK